MNVSSAAKNRLPQKLSCYVESGEVPAALDGRGAAHFVAPVLTDMATEHQTRRGSDLQLREVNNDQVEDGCVVLARKVIVGRMGCAEG